MVVVGTLDADKFIMAEVGVGMCEIGACHLTAIAQQVVDH